MIPISKAKYPILIELINETYSDRVEQILNAGFDDNNNIICVALDGSKRLGIEISDRGIKIKLLNPQAVVGQTAQMSAPAENLELPRDRDIIDDYAAQMATRYPFKPWLQQARNLLLESGSLEDYSTKLENLYPEMPSEEFNNLMIDAMTAASMAGYFGAQNETEQDAQFAKIPEGTTKRYNGVDYILKDSRWHRSEEQGVEKKNYNIDVDDDRLSISDDGETHHFRRYTDGSWRAVGAENNSSDFYDFVVPTDLRASLVDIANNPNQPATRDLMAQLEPVKAKAKRATKIDKLTSKFQQDVAKLPAKATAVESRALGDKYVRDLMSLSDRDLAEKRSFAVSMNNDFPSKKRFPITQDLSDFFQLIDKDLPVKSIVVDGDRAYADPHSGTVAMSSGESKRYDRKIVFHEAAHFIEFDNLSLGKANQDWIASRATGSARPLQELAPRHSYDDDEIALPDKFIDPYVGKVYNSTTTEVYSMGVERFSDGRKLVNFARKDPEHFARIIDYIKK